MIKHIIISSLIIPAVNYFGVKAYNKLTGACKTFFWRDTYSSLKEVETSETLHDLKRRASILVIDDEDSFPIDIFKNEGYRVDKWDSVTNYTTLENGDFDILILDIKGVAEHISQDDGLGVLENLKRNNPAQIIIAYSQHSYDLGKSRFWELADEKIAKPSDYLKIKGIIDNLLRDQFQPHRYIDCLHDLLKQNNYSEKQIKRIDLKIIASIKGNYKLDWNELFKEQRSNSKLLSTLINISKTIIKFY